MILESLNFFQKMAHASLGLMTGLENALAEIGGELEERYQELVARGAQDNSELAQQLRDSLDNGLLLVNDIQRRLAF